MKNVILPAILQPVSRRKDKSSVLKYETRELQPSELIALMALEGAEGYLQFSPNQNFDEVPEENAEVSDLPSHSERQRSILYVLYKQATKKGTFIGLFDSYYKQSMENIIENLKKKIDA